MPSDPCPGCGGSLQVPATPDRDLGGDLPDSSRLVDARALVLAWEQDRTPAG